jgi:hypothetical protein
LNNSPAKTGLVLKLSSSIKGRAEQSRGEKKHGRNRGKNRAKTEQKKAQIHREKERKGRSNTETRINLAIVFVPAEKKNLKSVKNNYRQKRTGKKNRIRESLGPAPANPKHQDPYHHSLRPEQGNSKAQTKSFLPEHNLKGKKGNREESEQGREYRN